MTVNTKITLRDSLFAARCHSVYSASMITAAQIRAARALLTWKQVDLAKASGVSEMSIKNIERGDTDPRVSTLTAIRTALETAGIQFLNTGDAAAGPGVALAKND